MKRCVQRNVGPLVVPEAALYFLFFSNAYFYFVVFTQRTSYRGNGEDSLQKQLRMSWEKNELRHKAPVPFCWLGDETKQLIAFWWLLIGLQGFLFSYGTTTATAFSIVFGLLSVASFILVMLAFHGRELTKENRHFYAFAKPMEFAAAVSFTATLMSICQCVTVEQCGNVVTA